MENQRLQEVNGIQLSSNLGADQIVEAAECESYNYRIATIGNRTDNLTKKFGKMHVSRFIVRECINCCYLRTTLERLMRKTKAIRRAEVQSKRNQETGKETKRKKIK
ncbi:MAG: hypothetical protein EZS28_046775 [Streblomastix strix]|uniref:Uncharacterized protein n=1 Tax=Streblomastix strix TaxID=222440 RepID=A0A5J4THK2_9EUKA|nr:MAG: hypothetical protein EZS28_046775 [Streblomastix strix]